MNVKNYLSTHDLFKVLLNRNEFQSHLYAGNEKN